MAPVLPPFSSSTFIILLRKTNTRWSFWSNYLFKEFSTYFGILRHIYTTVLRNWELSYNINTKFHIEMTPCYDSIFKSMKGQTMFDAFRLYVDRLGGTHWRYISSTQNNKCESRVDSLMVIYNVEVKIGPPSKVLTLLKPHRIYICYVCGYVPANYLGLLSWQTDLGTLASSVNSVETREERKADLDVYPWRGSWWFFWEVAARDIHTLSFPRGLIIMHTFTFH